MERYLEVFLLKKKLPKKLEKQYQIKIDKKKN